MDAVTAGANLYRGFTDGTAGLFFVSIPDGPRQRIEALVHFCSQNALNRGFVLMAGATATSQIIQSGAQLIEGLACHFRLIIIHGNDNAIDLPGELIHGISVI